jgi:hypothetical protein
MKNKFISIFGRHFDIFKLIEILDNMAEEEIFYWFAKCGGERGKKGISAFKILFDVRNRKYTSEEMEMRNKIIVRATDGNAIYD